MRAANPGKKKFCGDRGAQMAPIAVQRSGGRLELPFRAASPRPTDLPLAVARTFRTLAEGGEFESVYAMLMVYDREEIIGVELFELDDLETAKARFEELRPDEPRR